MSTQLKFRRGNTATATAFVGQEAEFFVNTDTNRVSIHDGSSPGGHVLASNTDLNSVNSLAGAAYNKANTGGTFTGAVTVQGDLTASANLTVTRDLSVSGNLFILGNTTSFGTQTLTVNDPMIILANGNFTSDLVDIGFAGHYNDGTNAHTGFIRDFATKDWYLFQNYTPELSGNNNLNIADASFRTANMVLRQATGNLISQFVTIAGRDQASVDSTQNTNITQVNQFAAAAYAHANNAFNSGNTFASIEAGIDATQNTRIQSLETVNINQNTSISIIQGVDLTQNTQIQGIQGVDLAQNASITIIQGVDNTQNTRLNSIETINTNQNTSISIIQGVDNTQNTQIQGIQGVNDTQNTNITAVNGFAAGAFNTANGANGLAAGAFDTANGANGLAAGAFNTANGANGLAAGAFAAANTKVSSVSGTSGRITSSGGTTPAIDLATSGVSAASYGSASAIPAFTVDAYGRITQANSSSFSAVTSAIAGTGISVSGATGAVTFTNSGVTSIVAGTGISISGATGAVTVTNGGVTSAVAGTGVSVSGATGAVTFSIGQAVATGSNVQFNSLGVGTAGSGTTGEIRATNNITAFYSDKRLKDIRGLITNALDKVLSLSGIVYTQNKKAEEYGYNNYEQQVGVIAQEVQAVLPEAVKPAPFDLDENNQSKTGENYLTVQYEKLVPLLIEAIKEQQKQIDELKAKIGN